MAAVADTAFQKVQGGLRALDDKPLVSPKSKLLMRVKGSKPLENGSLSGAPEAKSSAYLITKVANNVVHILNVT